MQINIFLTGFLLDFLIKFVFARNTRAAVLTEDEKKKQES